MIEKFFMPDVDEEGNFDLKRNNKNLPLFVGGVFKWDRLNYHLDALEISKYREIIVNYQGKIPVILLSFAGVNGRLLDNEFEISLKQQIAIAFKRFDFIYKKLLKEYTIIL